MPNGQPQISDEAMRELMAKHHRLGRAVQSRIARIEQLEAQAKKLSNPAGRINRRYKRYGIDYNFVPADLEAQTQSFIVDGGTTFYATEISSSFRVIGVANADDGGGGLVAGQTAQVTLGWGNGNEFGNYRNEFFSFVARFRDTHSDREWQDQPIPDVFLCSGSLRGLELPVPTQVMGGGEVEVTIDPVYSRAITAAVTDAGLFASVNEYSIHISVKGEEVRS